LCCESTNPTLYNSQALKKKLRAAAYTEKGIDVAALFAEVDKDGGGELDYDEFSRAIRKKGKLSTYTTSDAQLLAVFKACDLDGGGSIDVEEFADFLLRKPGDPAPNTLIQIPTVIDPNVHTAAREASKHAESLTASNQAKKELDQARLAAESAHEAAVQALQAAKAEMASSVASAEAELAAADKGGQEQAEEALSQAKERHSQLVATARAEADRCKQVQTGAQASFGEQCTTARAIETAAAEAARRHRSLLLEALESRYERAKRQYYEAVDRFDDRKVRILLLEVEQLNGGVSYRWVNYYHIWTVFLK